MAISKSTLREYYVILHYLCAVAVVSCLYTPDGDVPCPLQCACSGLRDTSTVEVTCKGAKFDQLPVFPPTTSHVYIGRRRTEIHRIKKGAFCGLNSLASLTLKSEKEWRCEEGALVNLTKLETIYLATKEPSILPKDAFTGMSVKTVSLELRSKTIPFNTICRLVDVESLFLNNNQWTNITMDSCMDRLINLTSLELANNHVNHLDEAVFKSLKSAKIMHLLLSRCGIVTMHDQVFNYDLRYLSMSNNEIRHLHADIFSKLTKLKTLLLASNRFTTIPCEAMKGLVEVTSLDLQDNSRIQASNICANTKFLANVLYLQLKKIKFKIVTSEVFTSTGRLRHLVITATNFTSTALSPLTILERLELEGGQLTIDQLRNALTGTSNSKLSTLYVSDTRPFGNIPNNVFTSLSSLNISTLKLINCGVENFDDETFSQIPNLIYLDLSQNKITRLNQFTFAYLKKLVSITLATNLIVELPQSKPGCWGLQPSVARLDLTNNRIQTANLDCLMRMEGIKKVILTSNKITSFGSIPANPSNITGLALKRNSLRYLPDNVFDAAVNLESLNLAVNDITLRVAKGNVSCFSTLHQLVDLNLDGVTMAAQFKQIVFPTMFHNFSELKHLHLESAGIDTLPSSLFVRNSQLESLYLSSNKIIGWDPVLFKPLGKLLRLSLSNNRLMTIQKEAFSYLTSLRELSLAFNPLVCNCDLMWFREWITDVNIYISSLSRTVMYHCIAPDRYKGVPLLEFHMSDADCRSYTFLKLSITFAAAVSLVLIITAFVYKFRFDISLFLFHLKSRQTRLLRDTDDPDVLQHDAFVVYGCGDLPWIIENLIPELEERRAYRLQVEDRDWEVGRPIVDNITSSIESSRKILLLISPHFASAPWCEEVLEMVQNRFAGRGRSVLIPVVLRQPSVSQLSAAMRWLLESHACLYWKAGVKTEKRFWKALSAAMVRKVKREAAPEGAGMLDAVDNEVMIDEEELD